MNKLRRNRTLGDLIIEAYEIGWAHASEQSDQLNEEWVDDVCERIAEQYEKAGTHLKGLKPIADSLRLAYEMGRRRGDELIRRLEIMREYMRDVDYWSIQYDHPESKLWFDEDYKVKL